MTTRGVSRRVAKGRVRVVGASMTENVGIDPQQVELHLTGRDVVSDRDTTSLRPEVPDAPGPRVGTTHGRGIYPPQDLLLLYSNPTL